MIHAVSYDPIGSWLDLRTANVISRMEKPMKSNLWRTPADRRVFIGGSDARIVMGNDEAALIQLWREKRGVGPVRPIALISKRYSGLVLPYPCLSPGKRTSGLGNGWHKGIWRASERWLKRIRPIIASPHGLFPIRYSAPSHDG